MYLGIDLGTSALKLVLLGADHRIAGTEQEPLAVSRPQPLWSEQAPAGWWSALDAAMLRLAARHAAAMADVCARLRMPESRFSRFFRRATGNTFTDFVNRMRITKACQLLMETDRYVTTICYEVGFNNVANFNRRFLEIKGMTPTDFRRQAASRFGADAPRR